MNWDILGLIPVAVCCFGPKFIHLFQPLTYWDNINLLGLNSVLCTELTSIYSNVCSFGFNFSNLNL